MNTDGKVDWIHGKVDWILPRTIPYYKVLLLQYYSVLQSATRVRLQYYSVLQSTTPHYKVLQIATPVPLQSTTPHYKLLVHCTTKYYSMNSIPQSTAKYFPSTTLYYTALLQHHSAVQTVTPYYSSTAKYYFVLQSIRYTVLQKYDKVLLQY